MLIHQNMRTLAQLLAAILLIYGCGSKDTPDPLDFEMSYRINGKLVVIDDVETFNINPYDDGLAGNMLIRHKTANGYFIWIEQGIRLDTSYNEGGAYIGIQINDQPVDVGERDNNYVITRKNADGSYSGEFGADNITEGRFEGLFPTINGR